MEGVKTCWANNQQAKRSEPVRLRLLGAPLAARLRLRSCSLRAARCHLSHSTNEAVASSRVLAPVTNDQLGDSAETLRHWPDGVSTDTVLARGGGRKGSAIVWTWWLEGWLDTKGTNDGNVRAGRSIFQLLPSICACTWVLTLSHVLKRQMMGLPCFQNGGPAILLRAIDMLRTLWA